MEGSHTFSVRETDLAGNNDQTPPSVCGQSTSLRLQAPVITAPGWRDHVCYEQRDFRYSPSLLALIEVFEGLNFPRYDVGNGRRHLEQP